jgi:hypothetical protein
MAFDAHKNFAMSAVVTPPSPPTSGTSLTVVTGEGALFPAAPFNATVCPPGVLPSVANSEIVRVTARSGDVLTITRAQEGSVARAVVVGDLCVASITAKAFQDIETTPYARTDLANEFVANQVIAGSGYSRLLLRDYSQAADSRVFQVTNVSQKFQVTGINDVLTVATPGIEIDRVGNLHVDANLYEKQRTTPLGHWIAVPYNTGDYYADAGAWTAHVFWYNKYTYIGKTMVWELGIQSSNLAGGGSLVQVKLPGGLLADGGGGYTGWSLGWASNASTETICKANCTADSQWIVIDKVPHTNWVAGNLAIRLTTIMPLQ